MNQTDKEIITRFPPSPTGNLHIGNIRTLLFNYLFTRHRRGKIVMRFEDTDIERSEKKYEEVALQTLTTLGLDFDEGPFRQSERTERYIEALKTLIQKGAAYVAEESQEEPGKNVIRFKNPNIQIPFTDIIRGEITIDTTSFGDFVIARSMTHPLYHLTVVVDDIDMHISHVIRGEDHITSTPRQILLIDALGGVRPKYAHLPLIVGNDKKKLSKRHGATTFQEFQELGIVPEALLNYLALLGWNPGDDREIFSKEELIQEFTLARVNNSPALFSYEKLTSINKQYLSSMEPEKYESYITLFLERAGDRALLIHPRFKDIVTLIFKERISLFSEVVEMVENGELNWILQEEISYTIEEVLWKDTTRSATSTHLQFIKKSFENSTEWNIDTIKERIWKYAEEQGKGAVLWPLRFVLTGQKKSPDPFTVAYLLGKDSTVSRLQNAIKLLE